MEREACVCDHGFERSDLRAEIIIIIITTSVPIGSLHKAPETPARGLRGQGLKGRFLNSTERRPSRCVRVEVHKRARRLKFLHLGMPRVARIRRLKHQR